MWFERIQNRFLRFVARQLHIPFDFHAHDYCSLRSVLNVPRVSFRFLYIDLSFLYILFNGFLNCQSLISLINLRVPLRPSRHFFYSLFHLIERIMEIILWWPGLVEKQMMFIMILIFSTATLRDFTQFCIGLFLKICNSLLWVQQLMFHFFIFSKFA